jgi:hypothetical protein
MFGATDDVPHIKRIRLRRLAPKKRRKDRNPQLDGPPSHDQSSIRNAPINPEESPSLRGPDLAPSGAGIKTFFLSIWKSASPPIPDARPLSLVPSPGCPG